MSDWRYLNLNWISTKTITQCSCIQWRRSHVARQDTSRQAITASKDGKRHPEVKNGKFGGCNLCVTACPVASGITWAS